MHKSVKRPGAAGGPQGGNCYCHDQSEGKVVIVLASSVVALWAYLTVARGQFWLARDPSHFHFMVPGGV